MPRKFAGNDAQRINKICGQETTLDRLRAAIDALDRKNQALQADVGGFQAELDDLRDGIEELAGSAGDYRFKVSDVETRALRHAARRLREISDCWHEDDAQAPDKASADPSQDVA